MRAMQKLCPHSFKAKLSASYVGDHPLLYYKVDIFTAICLSFIINLNLSVNGLPNNLRKCKTSIKTKTFIKRNKKSKLSFQKQGQPVYFKCHLNHMTFR